MANTYALDFEESSSQWGETPVTTLTNTLTTLTIETWVKLESLGSSNTVLGKWTTGGPYGWQFRFEDTILVFLAAIDGAGTNKRATATHNISLGTWTHIAVVYNGALSDDNKVILYVNTLPLSTTVQAGFPASLPDVTTFISYARDSGSAGSGGSGFLDSKGDEGRIWNTARSQAQIQANYNKQLLGSESGLIAYWKFNEGSGTSVNDETSSGVDLTLFNTPTWTTDVPFVGSSFTMFGDEAFIS